MARVADDMGRDWVIDPIYWSDVLAGLQADPEGIKPLLQRDARPGRPLSIPVPKTSLSTRPAVDLLPADRIAFQNLVDTFAWEKLADLPDWVCGWCYKKSPTGPRDLAENSHEWRRYEALLDAAWEDEPKFILVTDIAGFFQTIPHLLLRQELDDVDGDVRALLMDYLQVWQPRGVGLPQRVLGSSLLANIYLSSVDAVLGDYNAVRWMDDIAVFCSSRREGVKAFQRIEESLNRLGLFPNPAKTHLVPFEEAQQLLIDFRLRNVEYLLDGGFDEGPALLSEVWEELLRQDEVDRTKFSFCVTRFIDHDVSEPAAEVLRRLEYIPHVSDHASRYLRSQLEDRKILNHLVLHFRSTRNQFWWQEYRLATLFWHAERLTPVQRDFVRKRVANANTHWAIRGVYLRVLARHGSNADARRIIDMAENETNPRMMRAVVVSAAESRRVPRASITRLGRYDASLSQLVQFLRGRGWRVPDLSF